MTCVCVNQVRSRGLPEDHAGPIRIIDIEGIDASTCCGTHVSNLSHLQVQLHTRMQTYKHLDVPNLTYESFLRLAKALLYTYSYIYISYIIIVTLIYLYLNFR